MDFLSKYTKSPWIVSLLPRTLDPQHLLQRSSYFLFGARGTGKSTLIQSSCKHFADYIDLLDSRYYLRLTADPSLLHSLASKRFVVIDEVQRIPQLLNEVHRLIENNGKRFLLTGSSARQFKRSGVNLLAGRAFKAELFPLTWQEISANRQFDLHRYLRFGGLPSAYLDAHSDEFLYAYVDTYLREEIQQEGLVRNLPNYNRFLQSVALSNGRLLNYANVASDAGLPANTVRDYYQLLVDTLIGFRVSPWQGRKSRKAVQTVKFYLFDLGVAHALSGVQAIDPRSDLFGTSFEHFIACELRAFLSYRRLRQPLQFWRTRAGREVDFVIGEDLAVEVKSSEKVSNRDHGSLLALAEQGNWRHLLLVSRDPLEATHASGIRHVHWEEFLTRLWNGEYL